MVPNSQEFLDEVAIFAQDKWALIGIQLGIEEQELSTMEQHTDVIRRFSKIFDVWKRRRTSPFTWETILKALKSPSVGENQLAAVIMLKHGWSQEHNRE